MTRSTLELSGITKRFGPNTALRDVGLGLAPGSVRALVGENGAGKSTLLKIIAGVSKPTAGQMRLRDSKVDFDCYDPDQARRVGVSVVHQEFSLAPGLTVAENVFLGRELTRRGLLDRARMAEETATVLSRLGSTISPDDVVASLSVASVQVVEIAKALSIDAYIVAMDEPSAVLSGAELQQLFDVVRALRREGVAVLYVSHRLDEVFALCDTYTVLKDGEVSGSGLIADVDRDDLVQQMVGRTVSQIFPRRVGSAGPVRFEARHVAVAGLPAPVSLQAHGSEILGIVGLQGSGRTRLVKGLFGAIPASGEIVIDNQTRPAFKNPAEAMAAGIAFLPEDRKLEGLALTKTVRANVTLNVLSRLGGRLISRSAEKDFAERSVNDLDIRTSPTGVAAAGSLSGGNQQKTVLAKWLALDPNVLILDEPTRGIDVGSKEQIYTLVRSLADQGAAIILISSELVEILGLSDRLLVMADGHIVGELTHDEADEESVLQLITSHSKHDIAPPGPR